MGFSVCVVTTEPSDSVVVIDFSEAGTRIVVEVVMIDPFGSVLVIREVLVRMVFLGGRIVSAVEVVARPVDDGPFDTVDDEPFDTVDDEPFDTVDDEPFETVDDEPFETVDDESFETIDDEPFETVGDELDGAVVEVVLDVVVRADDLLNEVVVPLELELLAPLFFVPLDLEEVVPILLVSCEVVFEVVSAVVDGGLVELADDVLGTGQV